MTTEGEDEMAATIPADGWRVSGSRLVLMAGGMESYPDSSEILEAAFFPSYSDIRPQSSLQDTAFVRLVHDVGVHLGSNEGLGFVEIVAVRGDRWAPVEANQDSALVGQVWAPLNSYSLVEVAAQLEGLMVPTSSALTVSQCLQVRLAADVFRFFDDALLTAQELSEIISGTEPAGLVAKLHPYQRKGVGYLRMITGQRIGCILGDEMGLGKTMQVLSVLVDAKNSSHGPSLVVCPKSLLTNWKREANKFAPILQVLVHTGAHRTALPVDLRAVDLVVTSYETLVADAILLHAVEWFIVAVDEAQFIKNPTSQRSITARSLNRSVSIAVTGTPIETHIDNAWSLLDFAVPGLFGKLTDFERKFEHSTHGAALLAPLLEPLLLRRRVADVAQDLPELIQVPQVIPLDSAMKSAYEEVVLLAKAHEIQPLEAYRRLRMMTSHAAEVAIVGSGKIERLIEIVDEVIEKSQKVLVFAPFVKSITSLSEILASRYTSSYVGIVDGRISTSDRRQAIIDEFTRAEAGGCLVLNPQVAGVGLNITAANHVIHFSPEWNPAKTDQASARAFRQGQHLPVTVHHFAYEGTIEEKVIDRARLRREIAEEAAPGSSDEPTADDLLQLFEIVAEGRLT